MSRKGKNVPVAKIPPKPPTAAQKRAANKAAEATLLQQGQKMATMPSNFVLITDPTDGKESKQILVSDQVRNFIEMFADTEISEDLKKVYLVNKMRFFMVEEQKPQQPPLKK